MSRLKQFLVSSILANTNPTVTDDVSKGAYKGQRWLNGTSEFICTNPAAGAAVWTAVGGGGGGGAVADVNGRTGSVTLVGTDIPVFGASGGSHAPGAVPDPGGSAGSAKYLREDATWAVPAGGGGGSVDYAAAYNTRILAYGTLVSFWKCDETSGTTLTDSGPAANHLTTSATIAGAAVAYPGPPAIPGHTAGSFGCTSGYASIASPTSLPVGASARTMEGWFRRPDASTNLLSAFGYGSFGTRQFFGFILNDAAVAGDLALDTSGDAAIFLNGKLNDGQWHYVAAVYDGANSLKLFVDGALIVDHTLGAVLVTTLSGNGFQIQGSFGGTLTVFGGWVDNVAVYSTALTDAEIIGNYNTAKLGYAP